MKKLTFTLMLLIAFSTFVFADGETPGGGRTCQVAPCLAEPDDSFIKYIKDFLTELFG